MTTTTEGGRVASAPADEAGRLMAEASAAQVRLNLPLGVGAAARTDYIGPARWADHFYTTTQPLATFLTGPVLRVIDAVRAHESAAEALGQTAVAERLSGVRLDLRDACMWAAYGFGPPNPEDTEIPGEPAVPTPERLARYYREALAYERVKLREACADYDYRVDWLTKRIAEAEGAGDRRMAEALRAVYAEAYPRWPGDSAGREDPPPPPAEPPAPAPAAPTETPVIEVDFRPAPRPAAPRDLPPAAHGLPGAQWATHSVRAHAEVGASDAEAEITSGSSSVLILDLDMFDCKPVGETTCGASFEVPNVHAIRALAAALLGALSAAERAGIVAPAATEHAPAPA
jgi:hypothetical protein